MLLQCKDCLLFDWRADRYGVCEADLTIRSPNSRCPGALPNVDQDRKEGANEYNEC